MNNKYGLKTLNYVNLFYLINIPIFVLLLLAPPAYSNSSLTLSDANMLRTGRSFHSSSSSGSAE